MMDGALKLADNFYKVDINNIIIEKTSDEMDAEGHASDLTFINPRSFTETFEYSANGCSVEEINALKKSIQERGLLTALIGRIKNNKIHLINGHRRLLAIKELIAEQADCYDQAIGSKVPADELYSQVFIRLYEDIDELDCYVMAFEEDKTKVKFGAGTEYKFVQYCREKEIPDNKILEMTGNNQQWLDNVRSLLDKLAEDFDILDALFSNRMNISAAKKLSMFETRAERLAAFKEAYTKAEQESLVKKQKQARSIISTKKKIENALAEKAQASHSGDESAEEAADALIENYRQQEEKQKEAINHIETRVSGRNVVPPPAKSNIGKRNSKPSKSPEKVSIDEHGVSYTDIVSKWIQPMEKMLLEKNSVVQPIVLDFAKELLNAVIENQEDCESFLNRWNGVFENKGLVI
jgi:hypothetical protein